MAVIFVNAPGQVAVLASDGPGAGLPFMIDGLTGSWFSLYRSIITDLSMALSGNFQFSQSLLDANYAYVFGDKPTPIRVGGIAFPSSCAGEPLTGPELILNLYEQSRIANNPLPIQIQLGSTAAGRFRGYMTGLNLEITRPEMRLGQFSFTFLAFAGRRFA